MPPTDTTPLLPQPAREQTPAPQGDSHFNQKSLLGMRSLVASYLTSVAGVALKYKLESQDDHSNWRIPFQFSTVAFVMQWIYHLLALTWTGVHTFQPNGAEPDDEPGGSSAKARIARFFTPPHEPSTIERIGFSMFYTVSHIFTLLNTALYWTVLVPAGHGGFKAPEIPYHRHGPSNTTGIFYDPGKGLFEEDDIKAFSILNIWTITAVIAFVEVVFFNSIRRHSPVVGHVVGTMVASGLYLAWASIGKLATDHWGLFFLDPKLMGNSTGAAVAAGVGFVVAAPIILTYLHGLTAMREAITASH